MQHFEYYKIHQIIIQFAKLFLLQEQGKLPVGFYALHEKVSFLTFNVKHFGLDK